MKVFLSGIEAYGYHGVPDAEQATGHRYRAEIELDLEERASQTDAVDDTVDYGEVAHRVIGVLQGPSIRTVERLVARIGEDLLAAFPSVRSVRVRVEKLLPPVPFVCASAGAEDVFAR